MTALKEMRAREREEREIGKDNNGEESKQGKREIYEKV